MNGLSRIAEVPILGRVLRHRFTKFGAVGFSGLLVNLGVLYVCQEIVFRRIYPEQTRLNLSLAVAIFLATINNYAWNRVWTWRDRREQIGKGLLIQLGQYFVACWLAILLQFVLTRIFAYLIHYLLANVVAIVLAAVINFVLNDIWTFSIKRSKSGQKLQEKAPKGFDETPQPGSRPENPGSG